MPALVREGQSDDGTDPAAPRRADSGRAPVSTIVRPASPPWIVEKSESNRTSDRAANRALDRTGRTRHTMTDVEAAHRSAWNRQGAGSSGHAQAESAVN